MPNAPFLAPERDPAFRRGRAKAGGTIYYCIPGVSIATVSSGTPGLSIDIYEPCFVSTSLVVDQLAAEVVVASASTNFRIGFYASDTDWQPVGAPLADSGDLSSATTGVKTYTPGSAIVVPRGRYVNVFNCDSNAAQWTTFVGNLEGGPLKSTFGSSPFPRYLIVSRTYAAFPTPGTAWTTTQNLNTVGTSRHVVWRVSQP